VTNSILVIFRAGDITNILTAGFSGTARLRYTDA